MKSEINRRYYLWLEDLVESGAPPGLKYGRLFYILFNKEFTWTVPNDGNRLEDGKILRDIFNNEFATGTRILVDHDFPCSVLEVLISVAKRIEDIMYEPEEGNRTLVWLWLMITNLGLEFFTDKVYRNNRSGFDRAVEEILRTFIDRTYDRKGKGGLFPLRKPRHDQRKVEIWYQMQEFLDENFSR
jgi:hypothetical protein